MNHRIHIGRWIAAGAGALALAGAGGGIAAASAPPSSPPAGSAPAGSAGDAATGGPSDCAAVPAAPEGSTAPDVSSAPGGSAAPAAPATDDAASDTASDASAAPAPDGSDAAPAGAFVQVAETEQFGPVLVDHDCRTLYAFTQDSPGSPSCVEACAQAWPPLLVTDAAVPAVADELDPTLFSIVEHPESGPMLQVGDWPLYYFASDMAPGDLNGQGVGGVWWLVAPDGSLIENAGASSEPAGSDTGGAAASAPAETMGTGTMAADTMAEETGDSY